MEGSCIGFWKSKANSTFCKVVKQKGEAFWHRNTHVLCKRRVPKLQKAALFAIVCRFPVLSAALCKSSRIRRSRILGLYAGFLFYQRLVPKLQIVCRFSPWNVLANSAQAEFVGFGLGLLGGQGFIGAKASLDPLCYASLFGTGNLYPNSAPLNSGLWLTAFGKSEFFRCQSTFATRFCLRHCVFLC